MPEFHGTGLARVLIAAEEPTLLCTLNDLLASEKWVKVIGSCSRILECLNAIWALRPDLVLIDISMSGLYPPRFLETMKASELSTRIAFLGNSTGERDLIAIAMIDDAHVNAHFIFKDSTPDLLRRCVRDIAEGREQTSAPQLPLQLMLDARHYRKEAALAQAGTYELLTGRERDVVLLACEGLSNKEVGRRLNLAEGTVKIHLHNVYRKFDLTGGPRMRFEKMRHISRLVQGSE